MSGALLQNYSVCSGNLILVNAGHPFRAPLTENRLAPVCGENRSVLLERCTAALLGRLMSQIRGWKYIVAVSGWRSAGEQQDIWEGSIKENGELFTRKYVAAPGHSEHQTGLAIDLGVKQDDVDFIRPEFPYTGVSQLFRRMSIQYGFIQRYPADKESVTGIAHEPWHFRYVGMPHAEIMDRFGFALEEYHDFLRQYPFDEKPFVYEKGRLRFEISFLDAALAADVLPEIGNDHFTMVSGNNADGYIVTLGKNGEN